MVASAILLVAAVVAVARGAASHTTPTVAAASRRSRASAPSMPSSTTSSAPPAASAAPTTQRSTTTASTTSTTVPNPYSGAAPIGPVVLTGCPPATKPPPLTPPSHPSVLVPESALPTPPTPAARVKNLSAISGKGMFIWEANLTDGGNVAAIVRQATAAGLHQVWVRVGSSFDGFYGQTFLAALVPALHRVGIAVIGWGFPYLYDPVGDVVWTREALEWRAPNGQGLDGWGADIETGSEGTALSGKRALTYLGLVRPYMAGRPLVAIVYPPTSYWLANYPYQAMVPYIDAFAPMLYWSCVEPGADALMALKALGGLAPLHLIGQAYDMGPYGGRDGSPSGPEIARFLDVARRGGAVGASFWVWQDTTAPEWSALTGYRWTG
jgi:hypothetical protein